MIARDQPVGLPRELRVAVSSRGDGTMLDRTLTNRHAAEILRCRQAFCVAAGVDYSSIVYQIIQYGATSTYNKITEVTAPNNEGVVADILYTERPGVALFLPVADCVATVVYDPVHRRLALAHLGRHSTIANAMEALIEYFKQKGSNPADLLVWMAPSVKQESYRLEYFDHANAGLWADFCVQKNGGYYLDLQGYNAALAHKSGVALANITVSPVNTATDVNYFSHSHGDVSGRFAVVAMITS